MTRNKAVNQISQKVIKNYQPEKIYLFGSFAWGKPDPDSDIDFLIIKNDPNSFYKRSYLVRKAIGADYSHPIDIMVYTDQEISNALSEGNIFIKKVLTSGKKIYEKARN